MPYTTCSSSMTKDLRKIEFPTEVEAEQTVVIKEYEVSVELDLLQVC